MGCVCSQCCGCGIRAAEDEVSTLREQADYVETPRRSTGWQHLRASMLHDVAAGRRSSMPRRSLPIEPAFSLTEEPACVRVSPRL